jgi:GT2 family glycosyltransferase
MPQVIALTATYGRPAELARLLASLQKSREPVHALVLVDNAGDPAIRALAETATVPVRYEAPGQNLGCGGGLHLAEEVALRVYPQLTHVWILDDDAVVFPETLSTLLETMSQHGADAVHPVAENELGELSWFPGLLDRKKFRIARQPQPTAEFIRRCGPGPIPFSWCQGIALLVTRRVLDELGGHRTDYWVRGEDLEFALRITRRWRGLYVPTARVQHLPPASSADPAAEYPKHLALLQNVAYTSLRLPHGRRIARTLPGIWLRFHRAWGFGARALRDSVGAVARGAVAGRPAGA